MKPIIIGEGPSKSGDRYYRFPLSGQVGKRLCTWAGIEPLDRDASMTSEYARWYWALAEQFDLRNFYERWPQDWTPSLALAHLQREWLDEVRGEVVVLCGLRVQTVFRLSGLFRSGAFFVWEREPYHKTQFVTIPHPSGLNRLYNEEEVKARTGEVLREAIDRAEAKQKRADRGREARRRG